MSDTNSNLEALTDTFIRNVNHELRTPLAVIHGYAELLYNGGMGELAPEQHKALYVINDHIRELATLVERISVLLSTDELRQMRLPINAGTVAARVLDRMRDTVQQAGLTLETKLDPAVPDILGDPYQIERALECLVENAVKFTQAPGRITVRVSSNSKGVNCTVSDTGSGIETNRLEEIGQGFRQGDSSTTRHHRGFGLGMAVVQSVAKAHGGRVTIQSQPGQGSRFTLHIPFAPVEAPTCLPRTQQTQKPHRILVVDDEQSVVRSLGAALRRLPNCQISTATSGRQALALFEAAPFDLLITDFAMPDLDGLELATLVGERYPQTALIMITAYGDNALRERAEAAAVRYTLDKPVEIKQIRALALEALEAKAA